MALVIDIETVRDPNVGEPKLDKDGKPEFPSPVACQIVALCGAVVLPGQGVVELIAFGDNDSEEHKIRQFIDALFGHPVLVTWNGRSFDMPVVAARAMIRNVPFQIYDGYRYRYRDLEGLSQSRSSRVHVDLCDQLSDYGAARKPSLNDTCKAMGLPGKMDVDGKSVDGLYAQGKLDEIREYCFTDVIQTAIVFQRYAFMRGVIDEETFRQGNEATMRTLENTPAGHKVLDGINQRRKNG